MCAKKCDPGIQPAPTRELWLTRTDLEIFKQELLSDIRALLDEKRPKDVSKWLRSYQVKEMLSISSGTLQTLRLNGTLPYTKIQGSLFYNYSDIVKLLERYKK